jgi:hypothetical protein
MKRTLALATVAVIGLQSFSAPAFAMNDDEKAALAAAALIGLAALAHNKNHYRDGYAPNGAEEKAEFERGYRDGLHNEPFNPNRSSTAFAQGYDAGHKERANRLAHKNNDANATRVPRAAMDSCVGDAASAMSVGRHDIHVIKANQEGSDNFYIELAAGHRHFVCAVNSAGQIFDTRYGRL